MRLLHYSAEPFQFDPLHRYEEGHGFKPVGLWLSVDGEHSWKDLCEGAQWGLPGLKHVVEVRLRPDANVLLVDTLEKLDEFYARFRKTDDQLEIRNIKWDEVMALYDGMIISPYRWERRLEMMWYYGWDCASGVIWNLSAVLEVKSAK